MEDLMIVQNEESSKTNVKKEDLYLLASSVLLGVIFDILFYKKPLGISYPLFVIAFYLFFLGNLRRKITFKYDFGWFLSIPIMALSSAYFLFSNQIFAVFNFLIIPILIIAQTILINGENKYKWFDTRFLRDILYGIFNRAFGNTAKPFIVGLSSMSIRKSNEKHDVVKKVLIGLAISIPLLMIVISLLTAADQVFKHLIDEVLSSFGSINLSDFPLQGLLVLLISIIVFSYTWSFLKSNDSIQTQIQQGALENNKSIWDPIISITILSLINCVYLVFILIQFAYMFGAINNALPPDFTYAEYARRGFFELLMVTLINFTLLLSSIKFTKTDGKLVARTVRILHSLLVLCTMVILSSAFLRMSLYEAAYGYTYLRVLTHSFMIFLFILFVIALYKIWNEHVSLLKPYIVITLMAYLILNFANIDVLIAKNNIERYIETGKLDTHYLRNLSYDSIPVLVKLLDEENTPFDLKQYLLEQQSELTKDREWQSFNLSQHKAKKALTQDNYNN
ncbi:DUF4153 domain-containing protein [Desulfosporosinus nitroreducens]|uniref:DUF4173 domain-containing protein n=1 Tax=Desulfosporosinus nitroreducens TaxID=2018668 RepID=A0ABT8QYN8_9FIRM|nr:DUF4173 domain-containing protein [Desulfosporosinus nitroreducens]MDO0825750.1 DUF4173 domain-containing protein [Desulfosporosinus nitroreducens]